MKFYFIFLFLLLSICAQSQEEELLKKYKKLPKDTNTVNLIIKDAKGYRLEGKYKNALELMKYEDQWISKIKSINHIAHHYNAIALAYDFNGSYDTSIVYYKKSISAFKKIKDYYQEAKVLQNIGVAGMYKGDYNLAQTYFFKALKLAEKNANHEVVLTSQMNIGSLYSTMGRYKKALTYFQKSLNSKFKGSKTHFGTCYYNIATIHFRFDNFDSAIFYYLKAIPIFELQNDYASIADAKSALGAIMRNQGKYSEAAKYYEDALTLQRRLDFVFNPELYINAGVLYSFLNDPFKAYGYLDTARIYANKSKNPDLISKIFHTSANIHMNFKRYKEAYFALERYIKIHDSIFTDEKSKELEDVKTQYEIDKKTNEVKLSERIKSEKEKASLEAKAEEQDARNRTIIISVVTIAAIIIVFALIVYRRFQISKKQNRIIAQQKKEVEHQKELVDEKNKEIVDSINYAKRLQEAILPSESNWSTVFPESFILYKPKDIVAGDFYWLDIIEKNGKKNVLFAAADCTGHGVPGALVSVVCSNALNRSVNEFGLVEPGKILDKTTDLVIETFIKSGSEVKDGMDISLVNIEISNSDSHRNEIKKLKWSGANNSLWIVRNGELLEWKADKQPIGMYFDRKNFTTYEIEIQSGDLIYVFSDGYADQFGGEKKKKFKESSMKKLFISNCHLSMNEQKKIIENEFMKWKGDLEQIDDVCVIGIRI